MRPTDPSPGSTRSRLAARLGACAAALGIWQLCGATEVFGAASFPTVTATSAALGRHLGSGELWSAVGDTLAGWGAGLLVGGSAAVTAGFLLGLNGFAYRSALPVIELLRTVPVIAILPLAIVVFGPTLRMKVFLVAFGVFWPLVTQVIYGVRAVDPVVRDTADALRLRGLRRVMTVTLPSAAPFLATGLRIAAAVGLILAVIAELVGGADGLGLRILTAENAGPTELGSMYAFILTTGIVGVTVTSSFGAIERRLLHWHESARNAAARAAR